jgi:hypothetical protein
MQKEDPCICGSKKVWKSCCGQQLQKKETHAFFVSITGQASTHYFLGNMFMDGVFTDGEGSVLVFTNRAQALACNERLAGKYVVIGMSEEKWRLFQRDFPKHLVISDAVA